MPQSAAESRTTRPSAKSIGLRDLSRLAQVDISTVSRALNRDPRISAERAKAIRQLARKLGYRPRPLRSKRARAIGVLLASSESDRPDEQFLQRIAWHAQQVLNEHELHVNIECVQRSESGRTPLPAIVQQNRVDGVLLAGHPSVDLVRRLVELEVPAVGINDASQRLGISCVCSDPAPAIQQAVLRLAAWGHRQIGLAMNRMVYPTAQTRYDSYCQTLRDLSIVPAEPWFLQDLPADLRGGREAVCRYLELGCLPTAIIFCNDWMALGALQELQRRGYVVPRDISLVGHDDLWVCRDVQPALSTIRRDEHQMVERAVELLTRQINGETHEIEDDRLEGEMVWRDSAGPVPQRLNQ